MTDTKKVTHTIVEVFVLGSIVYALWSLFGTLADNFGPTKGNNSLMETTFRYIVPVLISVAVIYAALKMLPS